MELESNNDETTSRIILAINSYRPEEANSETDRSPSDRVDRSENSAESFEQTVYGESVHMTSLSAFQSMMRRRVAECTEIEEDRFVSNILRTVESVGRCTQ